MNRSHAAVIRTFAYWTVFVWVNRISNIFRDPEHDLAFKLVHSGLAAVSIVLAVAALLVVRSVRRRSKAPAGF